MEVDRDRAEDVAAQVFQDHGISEADARQTAEVLVTADAMNKHSHGLLRLPRFVQGIEHGNVDSEGTIEVVSEHGGAAAIDGGCRLGPAVASTAAADAI